MTVIVTERPPGIDQDFVDQLLALDADQQAAVIAFLKRQRPWWRRLLHFLRGER